MWINNNVAIIFRDFFFVFLFSEIFSNSSDIDIIFLFALI